MEPAQLPATGSDESLTGHFTRLQDAAIGDFAAWAETKVEPQVVGAAAGQLLLRFSEDVLQALRECAAAREGRTAGWIRREFAEALTRFGRALQERLPAAMRHDIAQVLQLRLLEAERRLAETLRATPPAEVS